MRIDETPAAAGEILAEDTAGQAPAPGIIPSGTDAGAM
jgi:hypothetical protein